MTDPVTVLTLRERAVAERWAALRARERTIQEREAAIAAHERRLQVRRAQLDTDNLMLAQKEDDVRDRLRRLSEECFAAK